MQNKTLDQKTVKPRTEIDCKQSGLALLNDRNKIVVLACDYWTEITDSDAKAERAFESAFREARIRGYLPKDLFVRVARWKSVRNMRNYELNTESDIRTATTAAFQASDDAEAISALVQLHGVALRTASAILHWMRPEKFPILAKELFCEHILRCSPPWRGWGWVRLPKTFLAIVISNS